jgi:hypothetical protein
VDTTSKLLQVNKNHSNNALIFYLIVGADTQLQFVSIVTYEPFYYIQLLQTLQI